MSALPEGWAQTSVGEVLEFKYGKGLPEEKRDKSGLIRVYGSNGEVGRHSAAVTNGPTIIVGRKGSVGEVHLSADACWPIDTTYFIERFPAHLPPKYWTYFLKAARLGQEEKSSAIPGISRDDIYGLTVALPPLQEQERIAAKVERLLAKANNSKVRLDKIPTIFKRFRKAVLAAACDGRLTADWRAANGSKVSLSVGADEALFDVPRGWSWKTIASVCANIVDCPHSTPRWTESGRICVRTTNFKPGILDLSEVRFVSEVTYQERIERLKPQSGDVIYSREGGILGIACMIPSNVVMCLGQRMMLFRASLSVDAKFLMNWLNSPVILRRVAELTGGSASPHLNVGDIKEFPIPIPPTEEQREIVRRCESLFAVADRLEKRYQTARAEIQKLMQSIFAKAFRGELVVTEAELARQEGRSYENAEELLARIRQNGAGGAKNGRPARALVRTRKAR